MSLEIWDHDALPYRQIPKYRPRYAANCHSGKTFPHAAIVSAVSAYTVSGPSVWPLPGLMLDPRLPFPLPRLQEQGIYDPTSTSLDWPLRICMARKVLIGWLKSWLSSVVSHRLGISSASDNSFRSLAGDGDCGPEGATAEVANCFFSPASL